MMNDKVPRSFNTRPRVRTVFLRITAGPGRLLFFLLQKMAIIPGEAINRRGDYCKYCSLVVLKC